jgi:hypothetical protein
LRRVHLRPGNTSEEALRDFVAFDQARATSNEIPSYRRIASSEDEEEAILHGLPTLEDEHQSKASDIERHLRLHPDDVDTWVKFSRLHLLLTPEISDVGEAAPITRANAEVTLSILDKALKAHSNNAASPTLHRAYLAAAGAFWPPVMVIERWKDVLRQFTDRSGHNAMEPETFQLWMEYLDWLQGQGFGKEKGVAAVDHVVDVLVECLGLLKADGEIGGAERWTG